MTFPTLYLRSLIASGFGVTFLVVAPQFAVTTTKAIDKSMVEWVSDVPAALFPVAGTGLLIWAAIYAVYVTSASRY